MFLIIFLWMGISGRMAGNVELCGTVISSDGSIISRDSSLYPFREVFVNAIFRSVVDSGFTHYYLYGQASPCSFVKFDYVEWVQYALQEPVTIDILNELAKKCYEDRGPVIWEQGKLDSVICLSREKTDSLLDPRLFGPPTDSTKSQRRQKRDQRQKFKKWSLLPAQERTVFYFSRPEFTDDGRYAVIDLEYRCDARLCGMGATCLFRHTDTGWKMIGRKIRWGG
ncbi:hypothetical protein ACX0G9_11570 [Flavitalea flava]